MDSRGTGASIPAGMEEVLVKGPGPLYLAAGVWVCFGLFLPLYRVTDFLLAGGLSVLGWGLGEKLIFPPKRVLRQKAVPIPHYTDGDPETVRIMAEGKKAIEAMRAANIAIEDEKVSAQIDRLEELSGKIFEQIAEDSKKTPRIRKFMNYYLPTTLKLLTSYDRMTDGSAGGAEIEKALLEIEAALEMVVKAFEKQLDNLFEEEALDISTDITVLEGMLAQEGLTDSDFSK